MNDAVDEDTAPDRGRPGGRQPVVSVVVPAHNEEAVVANGLRRLLAGTSPGEFDVVVVANACSDRTAEVARQAGVRVIETPVPGKAGALRLGDETCRTFPRVYLDADVELDAESVRALVAAAGRPGVLACAPVPAWDLAGVGWFTRRMHKVHDQLIAPFRALAGVGVYVLTEQGHARVFPLPDVISDDGWVHGAFAPHERAVVSEARSLVRPARTVSAHLNRRVRVRLGNRQLAELGRSAAEGRLRLSSLAALVAGRKVSPLDAGCYLTVLLMDRTLTRMRASRGSGIQWGTDTGSRSPAGG
ncbi:glycosyltransferase [Streptosporangium roseum]|uniref:4,4'-diaponeurosporenoate glycosyltransferase n=1 Tax=Streptosporangium roseum (strain ATCC 12428 / DSM 43021 / JCM 3005 / KCTC 9067 / NCIMB 10171 / NRRL 2505 / NI 9100) TaxID=479432 RepID=D2B4I9_STRRD|nr:glycosyltransferase [Streptosporangium roseum]ACZ83675.1 Glycosyltransferase involved in cell wall biogenesis-like protein [Streptosporangium roseum DSM 43021]